MLWKLPKQTNVKESRNCIHIDSEFSIVLIKELIDAVFKVALAFRTKYMNVISNDGNALDNLTADLIETVSHKFTHIIEGNDCKDHMRAITHDHYFKLKILKFFVKLPDTKELMIMQLFDMPNYLELVNAAVNTCDNLAYKS